MIVPRALKSVAAPAAILIAATAGAIAGHSLTASHAAPIGYAAYLVLVLGAAISVWFNRGRAFLALMSMLLGYAGVRLGLAAGAASFAPRAAFTGMAIFVPLNVLAALLLPERGVMHYRNYRWLLLVVVEVLLTAWIASAGRSALSGTVWKVVLDHWLLRAAPTPFLGRLLLAGAFVAALAKAWDQRSPLEIGMVGALAAFFVACEWVASTNVFSTFLFAAGAILLVAVLQESHRLAFRDELTGLPSRRALEEQLLALGPVYTIAMVDVDHFKKFNDTHGHDVGDQVLKLVAARLGEVEGGGRAFRYGGEEFCVLFPDRTLAETLPYLEQIRARIESYKMAVRIDERRKEPRSSQDRRTPTGKTKGEAAASAAASPVAGPQPLSVTVSIGVAERSALLTRPTHVLRTADEALYRAKQAGRNRVSR
ncbi:MAG TPA: GGDEF domain-containing protein [Burkholderiales bacterium]|nr:GGDEF domain-containing protein [Burkholderiales bacterium]